MGKIKPFLSDKEFHVLQRIQENVPKDLMKNLIKKEYAAPTMRKVAHLAVKDKNVPLKEKRRIQNLIDTGFFDKTVDVVDTEIEKKLDRYYETEIKKAQERGELPKGKPRSLRRIYQRKRAYYAKKANHSKGEGGK